MSFPSVGYGDGLRLDSWMDDNPKWTVITAQTQGQHSGALNMRAYWGVYMSADVSVNQMALNLNWYADEGLTKLTGKFDMMLDPNVSDGAQLCVPNLGPWLDVDLEPVAPGTNFTPFLRAYGSNRPHPLLLIPPTDFLGSHAGQIAAGGNLQDYFPCYYGGPATVYTFGGDQGITVKFSVLGGTFTYADLPTYTVAANTTDIRTMIFPPSATQYVLTNVSGAAICHNMIFRVIASRTGAG